MAQAMNDREGLLEEKERQFTQRESVTMKDWLLAAVTAINRRDRQLGKIAEEILDTGLAAEHWLSLLHEDPEQRTQAQTSRLDLLDHKLAVARKKFSDYMRGLPNEPPFPIERPNAP